MAALRIESVRARLTLYYVSVLAAALLVVCGLIYVLLARALHSRVDDNLHALLQITSNSLDNDLAEGQDVEDAARSTAAELSSRQQMLAIYDASGRLLAEEGKDTDLDIVLPPLETIPSGEPMLMTVAEKGDEDDRHRLGLSRITITPYRATYIVVAGMSLEPTDEELEAFREILVYVVPIALLLAGLGGWFLAYRSLAPVVAMADRARQIGFEDLSGRLPVANPRDELGRLAQTFNDLLGRLDTALTHQRQFMADASHELRTPVTISRTAASVALQLPHRDEREYRETLTIVEQQAVRLSRLVDDMFTLAWADAGDYPVRREPMYLDEVIHEVVSAARVMASTKNVTIECETIEPATLTGDEELIRRLVANLLDNAIRHTPVGTVVRIRLQRVSDKYEISVTDRGPGIPVDSQARIFERFYRVDVSRSRQASTGGAGLGLALARWIAQVHDGDLSLTRSSEAGSTFTALLSQRS